MAAPRIVSLLPSSTEIVCALGFKEALVGRSHECDFPSGVERLPICTEAKIPLSGTSYEIDQRLRAIVQEGLSVYRVFAERLAALRPDVIVTQSQCEVCAVSFKEVERVACEVLGSRPTLVSLEPNSLACVFEDFRRVARALDVPGKGEALVTRCREQMEAIAKAARRQPARPRVACIEWIAPPMAAGNWMPELVEMAGGINLFGEAGEHSPWIGWEDVVDADPDVIVVLPCGFGIDRAAREMDALTARAEWPRLQAVRSGRVYLTDGHHYFNRPGPRLVESLEILVEIFHPGLAAPAHEGRGWRLLAAPGESARL